MKSKTYSIIATLATLYCVFCKSVPHSILFFFFKIKKKRKEVWQPCQSIPKSLILLEHHGREVWQFAGNFDRVATLPTLC